MKVSILDQRLELIPFSVEGDISGLLSDDGKVAASFCNRYNITCKYVQLFEVMAPRDIPDLCKSVILIFRFALRFSDFPTVL